MPVGCCVAEDPGAPLPASLVQEAGSAPRSAVATASAAPSRAQALEAAGKSRREEVNLLDLVLGC